MKIRDTSRWTALSFGLDAATNRSSSAVEPAGRELENQLGFRLFDRTTRHVALTAHGSQLLAVARRSLEEIDAATSRIAQTAKKTGAELSVGAGLVVDFYQIRNRGRKLSPAAEEFSTFLQGYIARWAGRAGIP